MTNQKATKEQCYAVADKLKETATKYVTLIIQEPGSHHPDCYIEFSIEDVTYTLRRRDRHVILESEFCLTLLTDSKLVCRLEGMRHLPSLLKKAKEYTSYYHDFSVLLLKDLESQL